MRRRRPFRRPFRRPGTRQVPPELRRANALMESGQYAEAARAFERIATQAERRRGARAPIFYLRAGLAYAHAHKPTQALTHTRKGLEIITARRDWEPLQRFGQRAINEFKQLGYEKEANEITAYLDARITSPPVASATEKHIHIPTNCPACGAPLHPHDLDWLDEKTAECVYCGNLFRGED